MWYARVQALFRNLFRRRDVERELDDELSAYVELIADEHVARGLTPEEARRAARLEAGGVEQTRERVREGRAGHLIEQLIQDARYALRLLARSPGFAAVAVLTLALGIGATTAIFSVVHGVLLRPLPYPEPDRLVRIYGSSPKRGWGRVALSHADVWDIHDQQRAFTAVGAMRGSTMSLTGLEYPERLRAAQVNAGFFAVLGVPARVGRHIRPGEDRAGGDTRVVVLTHAYWTGRFGGDPAMLGRSLTLDGEPYRVIGVAAPDPYWLGDVDIVVPLVRTGKDQRGSFEVAMVGRLRPGVTVDAARAELLRLGAIIERSYPPASGFGLVLTPSSTWRASDGLRRALWLLMGAVGLLLLIACVNLSNMLLARSATRSRETVLRAALGATRGRLVRQTLAETLVLGGIGALSGIALAAGALGILRRMDLPDIPRLADVTLSAPVLAFAIAVMLGASGVIALAPVFHLPRGGLLWVLRETERSVAGSRTQQRFRHLLIAVEVALSVILLVGAGLLLRSLDATLRVERGFETANRVLAAVNMPASTREDEEGVRTAAILRDLLDSLESIPGVRSAAAVSSRPLTGGSTGMGIGRPDQPDGNDVPWATWRLVTPGYFRTMGTPLLRGRTFTPDERMGPSMKVIVSKRVADLLWPGEDPVGRAMVPWKGQGTETAEVIGVVGDMRERGLANDPTLAVYLPYLGAGWSPVHFVLQTEMKPEALVPLVREAVARVDPTLPVSDVQSFDGVVAESMASRRFIASLLATFAGVALTLALVGIYGVVSYSVERRRTEIGVRMALGASAASVQRLVLAQGLRPVIIGLVAGAAAAAWLARLMQTLLFGVTPGDPATYAGIAVLLATAAACACILPAYRASRVEVTSALRAE